MGGSARFNDSRGKVTIGEKVSPADSYGPLETVRMSQSFISTARRKERIIALFSWLLQIAVRDGGQS